MLDIGSEIRLEIISESETFKIITILKMEAYICILSIGDKIEYVIKIQNLARVMLMTS